MMKHLPCLQSVPLYPGKHEQLSVLQAITPSQLVAPGIISVQSHCTPGAQGTAQINIKIC
jgi:hypothetical protein